MKTGVALGRDIDARRPAPATIDAVFLGVGLAGVNKLGLAGEDALNNVDRRRRLHRRAAPGAGLRQVPVGRRVVVIGGGMTAVDAAVQAKRLGAEQVTIVYRRGARGHEGERLRARAGADQRRD